MHENSCEFSDIQTTVPCWGEDWRGKTLASGLMIKSEPMGGYNIGE